MLNVVCGVGGLLFGGLWLGSVGGPLFVVCCSVFVMCCCLLIVVDCCSTMIFCRLCELCFVVALFVVCSSLLAGCFVVCYEVCFVVCRLSCAVVCEFQCQLLFMVVRYWLLVVYRFSVVAYCMLLVD